MHVYAMLQESVSRETTTVADCQLPEVRARVTLCFSRVVRSCGAITLTHCKPEFEGATNVR